MKNAQSRYHGYEDYDGGYGADAIRTSTTKVSKEISIPSLYEL